MSPKRFLSAFPVLAVAAAAFVFALPVLADEIPDDDGVSIVARALGAVGILAIPGPGIDYTERPPLVVPPTMTNITPNMATGPEGVALPLGPDGQPVYADAPQPDIALPQPVTPSNIRARHPDFPVDPETRAAQKAKKKKKGPSIMAEDPFYGGRLLRRDEMRVSGPVSNSGKVDPQGNQLGGERSSIHELNVPVVTELFGKKKEQPVEFTGEPPRQSLTQPPAGYLTPSANAPYGVVGPEKYVPARSGPSNSPQTAPTSAQ